MTIATKQKGSLERLTGDKYFNLIEHAADGIAIIQDGVFRLVNTVLAGISGYDKEELLGMPFTKLLTPESQKLTMARYQSRLAGKEVPPIYEIKAVTKDGEVRDIEINAALTEYEGRIADEVIIRDITERKQVEEELKLRAQTLDGATDSIFLHDFDGNFIYVNETACKTHGYTREEFMKMKLHQVIAPERVSRLDSDFQEMLEKGQVIFESAHLRKDGSIMPAEVHGGTIESGGRKLLLTVIRDITERKQAEQQLQEKNEQLDAQNEELRAINEELQATEEQVQEKNEELDTQNEELRAINEELQATEEELQQNQEKLERMFESVTDGILVIDLNGVITQVNQRTVEMHGFNSKDELLGKSVLELVAPRDHEKIAINMRKAVKQGIIRDIEYTLLRADGSEFPGEVSASMLKDASGNPVGHITIARDITKRKQAEQQLQEKNEQLDAQNEELRAINEELRATEEQVQEKNEQLDTQNEELRAINEELQATEEELQQSQEKLERMFESVTDGIVVANLDGTILKVNEKAVQMHGFASEDELLGKNAFELVAPRNHKRIANNVRKALKEGLIRGQEYTLLKSDGSEFPGELSTSALKDASGNVIGHITIVRDITKRKQMEELFKTVTNSSPVGIYIIQDGKFQLANPQFQKLTGYTEDELLGMDSLALVLDEDKAMVREKAVKMLKGEHSFPYQFRVVNKSGETRWVMETVTSIQYRGRRAILGNYMDITERRQSEERERQLQQELNLAGRLASIGQMASGVAHEINNPLTGVIGFSHLLMSRDIPDDMKQDLQVINSEAQRVAKIVENLLTFARQRKPGREYVDINDIAARVLELRSYEMKVNNIEVETQLAPDLPPTMADAGQLQQVFLNIILNAEHFMTTAHNKGKLLVKTERIDNNIRASFTDDGSGISKENLDKIFNPFFTTKEVGNGTGLGLSICHGIITQHKGRIYAQSESGQGATFVVELPIVDDANQTKQAEITKDEPKKPRGAKILVVDDEPAILAFLRRLLTEWGHSVETINNAKAALERLKTERYSLILLDIKLPGMSGVELYRQIEAIAPALTRRVMFITGDIMETATRDFLDRAKVPHITKPIDTELLKKTINHALNQTHVAATTPE